MTARSNIENAQQRRHRWPAFAALALFAAALFVAWPGVAMYDTVRQYEQVLSGTYDDWHPPVMARLWSLLQPVAFGTGPMFLLQLAGYWLGLGALARALGGRRAAAMLVVGALPVFLGWQVVVLKDAQLVAALVCATGLVASARLTHRPLGGGAILLVACCFLYAALLRANAAFSVAPLAALLFVPGKRLRWAALVAGIPLLIAPAQYANRHILMARDSGVGRVEAIYDLSAIAVRSGDIRPGGGPALDIAALTGGHCVKALFWDPLMSRDDCTAALNGLDRLPTGALYAQLARAALAHPFAYTAHRLAHLNATLRWLVPYRWPLAPPPAAAEPNTLGLASPPCCALLLWQRLGGYVVETPLGWPVAWLLLGFCALARVPAAAPGPRRDIALALLVSALCQEASFAILSISSDLRYHLWAMLAVALAWVLLGKPGQRPAMLPALALALVLLAGLAARFTLPRVPTNYAELLN